MSEFGRLWKHLHNPACTKCVRIFKVLKFRVLIKVGHCMEEEEEEEKWDRHWWVHKQCRLGRTKEWSFTLSQLGLKSMAAVFKGSFPSAACCGITTELWCGWLLVKIMAMKDFLDIFIFFIVPASSSVGEWPVWSASGGWPLMADHRDGAEADHCLWHQSGRPPSSCTCRQSPGHSGSLPCSWCLHV